ncbi:YadA C-terminal domain-containing protein, partial [Enterobacter roggenkampii]
GKNSLNRLIRCVCGKKIGPDPRNFNQRVSLGRNDLLIRTFPNKAAVANVQSRQQAQETTIQNHSAQLANHESRITALESQNNAKFSSLENQQNEDRKEYRAGIAGAASLAGLHYVDTDNAVAVGAANFKDAQGYAVGYRHKFAENIAATLSTSGTSNGDEIVAASASYGW